MPATPDRDTTASDAPSPPDDGTPPRPPSAATADAAPSVRGRMRTLTAAALGVVASTLLAGAVATYFDVWSSSRSPVPAGRAMHAEAEVWWDLTRDTKAVRMPGAVDVADLEGGDVALDGLAASGGTYAGTMRIRVTLMNFTKVPVAITEVRARVTDEKPTPKGALLSCGGAEGSIGLTRLRIDLGDPDKAAQEYDGENLVGHYPTQELQLAKQDEPAVFDIRVEDGEATASYVLDVVYQQGTERGRVVVDDSGKPFVLAPAEGGVDSAYRCDEAMAGWDRLR